MPVLSEMMQYARTRAVLGKLKPGSWAEAIHHAAAAGEVLETVPVMEAAPRGVGKLPL
jgi:hypothetical protein